MKKYFLLLLISFTAYTGIYAQSAFCSHLAKEACVLATQYVEYDPAYFKIDYPNGDVPKGKGVCTDVIIRAYRLVDIDLQQKVHEDMKSNFTLYPQIWGLSKPDKNIDHRRVPNLMVFFKRHGIVKPVTTNRADYLPGDIVCYDLGAGLTHIGLVVNKQSPAGNCFLLHNIGAGQVLEDCLFDFKIIGHYTYQE